MAEEKTGDYNVTLKVGDVMTTEIITIERHKLPNRGEKRKSRRNNNRKRSPETRNR